MPSPLPEAFAEILRSDSTAALAALTVIAASNRDLLAWAASQVRLEAATRKANGHGRGVVRVRQRRSRMARRDRDDENLLQAMRGSPEGSINDWAAAIGKSRTTAVTVLRRLREGGRAESVGGRWCLVEPAAHESASKWTAPLSGKDRAAQTHLTAAS